MPGKKAKPNQTSEQKNSTKQMATLGINKVKVVRKLWNSISGKWGAGVVFARSG